MFTASALDSLNRIQQQPRGLWPNKYFPTFVFLFRINPNFLCSFPLYLTPNSIPHRRKRGCHKIPSRSSTTTTDNSLSIWNALKFIWMWIFLISYESKANKIIEEGWKCNFTDIPPSHEMIDSDGKCFFSFFYSFMNL